METALFIKSLLSLLLFFIVSVNAPTAVWAQSSDRNNPTVLQSNQIRGQTRGEGGNLYYVFNAGPGEVTLTVDGKTDYYGTSFDANIMESSGRRVGRVNLSAGPELRASANRFVLTSNQSLLLQLHYLPDNKIRSFDYRVTLTGAVHLRDDSENDPTFQEVQNSVNNFYAQNQAQAQEQLQQQIRPNRRMNSTEYYAGYPNRAPRGYNRNAQQEFAAKYNLRAANIGSPRRIQQNQILNNRLKYLAQSQPLYQPQPSYTTQMQSLPKEVPSYQPYNQQPPQQIVQQPVQQISQTVPPVQNQIAMTTSVQAPSQAPAQSTKVKTIVEDTLADASVDTPITDKWAIVIGVSKFADSSINLNYPAKDAKDFRDYLVNEAHFQPDHIRLLTDENATKAKVVDLLGDNWLPRRAFQKDLVVIYISTHGSPSSADSKGVNFLLLHDTDPQRLYATGLAVNDISTILRDRVNAERILMIMDACHSGSAEAKGLSRTANVDAEQIPIGDGSMVICSSKPDQVSWESKRYGNGVFTAQLLKSLREKGNKCTLRDAFKLMQDNVETEVLKDRGKMQTPVLKTRWKGSELILSTTPTKPHSDSDK